MLDLEQEGFTKIEWDGLVPSPLPVPHVPYWGVNAYDEDPFRYLFSLKWHPNYDGKGSSGFLMLEDIDCYITREGKWAWDCTVEDTSFMTTYQLDKWKPYTDVTHIKRVPSPLSEDKRITTTLHYD